MWTPRSEPLAKDRIVRFTIDLDSNPVSHAEVLRRWHSDPDFRSLFIGLLANSPFSVFDFGIAPFFETAAPQYEWINRIIPVGIGHLRADGPLYSLFEVL